jgi:hypothetical protein
MSLVAVVGSAILFLANIFVVVVLNIILTLSQIIIRLNFFDQV